jgi:hypothetical protein
VRVKLALALALFASLAFAVWLGAALQDAAVRTERAEDAVRRAEARVVEIERWVRAVNDSLGVALALAPPPAGVHVPDSVRWALAARAAGAAAETWRSAAVRARQLTFVDPGTLRRFRLAGHADPALAIRDDLVRHPELIPYEGVLGGRMQFVRDEIAILSGEWVYAPFEDGHVRGACLLAYDITRRGEITWRRLAAREAE